MKTIAIIGGGLSGLSAGVYGQMAGFQTTIYEKSKAAGGCCFGWERNGYLIDNCIHWLCGTRKCSGRKIWEDLGALSDDTELWQREEFYTAEVDGQRITLWRDLDRT